MQNLKTITKTLLTLISIITLTSCEVEKIVTSNKDPAVVKTKIWYDHKKPNMESLNFTTKIDWEKAIVSTGVAGTIVEVPLIMKEDVNTNIGDDKTYKTRFRLMFLEDEKETYKTYTVMLTTNDTTFNNTNTSINAYTIDKNYSGYVTIQNAENTIIDSKKYYNGEKISSSKKTNITARWECRFTIRVATLAASCGQWIWIEDPYVSISLRPDPMPVSIFGYGGGTTAGTSTSSPSTPAPNTIPYCYYQLDQMTKSAYSTSQFVSSTMFSENSNTRSKQYTWKIFNFLTYNLFSIETGTHKKATNPNAQWEWVSLTHNNIYSQGQVVALGISYNDISNLGTVGQYNAIMSLNYNVKFSLGCQGVPVTNEHAYPANHIFNIND